MSNLFLFVFEHTIINTAPIFGAASIIALFIGRSSIRAGASKLTRTLVYSSAGTAAGIIAYDKMTIPERSIEITEAIYLASGMFLYSVIIIGAIISIKGLFNKNTAC